MTFLGAEDARRQFHQKFIDNNRKIDGPLVAEGVGIGLSTAATAMGLPGVGGAVVQGVAGGVGMAGMALQNGQAVKEIVTEGGDMSSRLRKTGAVALDVTANSLGAGKVTDNIGHAATALGGANEMGLGDRSAAPPPTSGPPSSPPPIAAPFESTLDDEDVSFDDYSFDDDESEDVSFEDSSDDDDQGQYYETGQDQSNADQSNALCATTLILCH